MKLKTRRGSVKPAQTLLTSRTIKHLSNQHQAAQLEFVQQMKYEQEWGQMPSSNSEFDAVGYDDAQYMENTAWDEGIKEEDVDIDGGQVQESYSETFAGGGNSLLGDSSIHPWRNYCNIAMLHSEMKQWDKAAEWFRRALDLEPNAAVVRVGLSTALEQLGELREAWEQLHEASKLDPSPVLKDRVEVLHESLQQSYSSRGGNTAKKAGPRQLVSKDSVAGRDAMMQDMLTDVSNEVGMSLFNTQRKRDLVVACLSKDSRMRTTDDLDLLQRLTSPFNFFKNLPSDVHSDLCRFMTYQQLSAMSIVIKEGDIGDCMYVILSGNIAVLHPKSFKGTGESSATFRDQFGRALPPKNFTLASGIAFGEMALASHQPRASYCVAETDVEVLIVPKEAYTELIQVHRESEVHARANFLTDEVPAFASWPRERASRLALHILPRTYSPEQTIFKQGEEPEGLVIVRKGRVRVYRQVTGPSGPAFDQSCITATFPSHIRRDKMLDQMTENLQILDMEASHCNSMTTHGVELAVLGPGALFGGEIARFGRRNTSRIFPSQFQFVADTYVDAMVLPKNLMFNLPNETVEVVDETIINAMLEWTSMLQGQNRWQNYRNDLVSTIEQVRQPKHGPIFSKQCRR